MYPGFNDQGIETVDMDLDEGETQAEVTIITYTPMMRVVGKRAVMEEGQVQTQRHTSYPKLRYHHYDEGFFCSCLKL